MSINILEDIRSVTDLKRHTRELLDQVHQTGRPIILTVNGKADAVLLAAETYEKQLMLSKLVSLLDDGEKNIETGEVVAFDAFLKEFKHAKKI